MKKKETFGTFAIILSIVSSLSWSAFEANADDGLDQKMIAINRYLKAIHSEQTIKETFDAVKKNLYTGFTQMISSDFAPDASLTADEKSKKVAAAVDFMVNRVWELATNGMDPVREVQIAQVLEADKQLSIEDAQALAKYAESPVGQKELVTLQEPLAKIITTLVEEQVNPVLKQCVTETLQPSSPATNQSKSAPKPAPKTQPTAKTALARRVIQANRQEELVKLGMDQVTKDLGLQIRTLVSYGIGATPEQKQKVDEFTNTIFSKFKERCDYVNLLVPAITSFYEEHYTDAELESMLQFYTSPAGTKLLKMGIDSFPQLQSAVGERLKPKFGTAGETAYLEAVEKRLVPKVRAKSPSTSEASSEKSGQP